MNLHLLGGSKTSCIGKIGLYPKARPAIKTHKYGFKLPTTLAAALVIDKATGTNFWAKAIAKEMKKV
jgi:hypothetical protein